MFRFARSLSLMGGALTLAALASVLLVTFARADGLDSGWLAPAGLNLQKTATVLALPPSINGNIDCFQDKDTNCVVNTSYGLASMASQVKFNGTSFYAPIYSYVDSRQHFIAVPNSNTAISYTTDPPYGLYLYFNHNFSSSITLSEPVTGPQFQINRPPAGKLADKDGHRLAADYDSMSFSENSRWMVVSVPNIAVIRVNMLTFEVTPFAPGFNYAIGLSPGLQTAISNDGRYAALASKDFSRFAIYDLSTCTETPTTITSPVTCQSRDLHSLMTQQVGDYISSSHLRFISDETLSLYATYGRSTARKTTKYILSTAAGVVHQQDYLALGDSFISGEGAFGYLPETDTNDNSCHVSLISYPYLLGHDLNYNSYHSVACSGATTNDVINTSDDYRGQTRPYATRRNLNKDYQTPTILDQFLQGYIDQLDFVIAYQPKTVTISIGGNDIGFSARLRSCLSPGTCYKTYEDRLEFVREVNSKFPTLVNTYTKIKNVGMPDTKIYAIGYPQIAKAAGDCAVNVLMDNDELAFAALAIDYLDRVIEAAAATAGVTYVDTQSAFNDHRLCEAKAGSVAVNGVTAGDDFPDKIGGPIGRESYHPNELGHGLLEQTILAKTQKLTKLNPAADPTSGPPAETGLEILSAPHSGRPVNVAEYDPGISQDVLFKHGVNNVSINGAGHSLKPATLLRAKLHSDPFLLGNYSTDNFGNLLTQLVIPEDVSPGYHALHFYGHDITGQPIDIYKIVYVADSPSDLYGDAITDDTQDKVLSNVADSQEPASSTTQKPKVLSESTTKQPSSSNGVEILASPSPANLELLAGANIVGVSLAMSYAFWKFWG